MAKHANEEVGVQSLKDILSDNVHMLRSSAQGNPKVLAIADTLEKAVNYSGDTEQKFIDDLKTQNKEKFGLIKDYLQSEKNSATRLKTEVDNLMKHHIKTTDISIFSGLNSPAIQIAALNGSATDNTGLQKRIVALNDAIIPSLQSITS